MLGWHPTSKISPMPFFPPVSPPAENTPLALRIPKNFQTQNPAGRRSGSWRLGMVPPDPWPRGKVTPAPLSLGVTVCGPWRAVAALRAVDLSFRGEVLGRISGFRCPRRAMSAKGKATALPTASSVSSSRSRPSGLCLDRKPEHLRTALPPSQCDLQFPLQGFRDTNHMERLAEGRIAARYILNGEKGF